MAHDHEHHHHSHSVDFEKGSKSAFIIGICLNTAFVLAEIIGGIIYHSMALLTDAGHNAGDVASLILSLLAFTMAERKSSPIYTYGYKKQRCWRRSPIRSFYLLRSEFLDTSQ